MLRFSKNKLIGIISIFIVMLTSILTLTAQPTGSRGRDFWLAFMPNFHPNGLSNNPALRLEDSLSIFIAATAPTRVTISYPNLRAPGYRDTVINITNTSIVYSFSVPWEGYELEGFNHSGQLIDGAQNQNETPARQTFHVVSEKDISVYALNQARTTSDAFLVLPTPVLGVDHYVMSYNSDGFFDTYNNLSSAITPSQFIIVAVQDNTQLQIVPTAPTSRSGKSVKNITLNTGQAYLVQAQITQNNLRGDLTGTHITSSKPVAVFGGHQRATLPLEYRDQLSSRDCLIEQIPSVEVWGKSAFLAPYPPPKGATLIGTDIYRVMAALDSTPVFINGNQVTLLNAGQFYEDKLISAGTVTSSKPILVAQFKKTSGDIGNGSGSSLRLGDPFMMLIPPAEQFLNFYRCINAQAWELPASGINRTSPVYENQYITVVAPNTTLSTVRIDGRALTSQFVPIPGVSYSYAWEPVADGAHTVEADEPIGIYVYGYGLANSYGYVGDMNFRPFDYRPPQIASLISCYEAQGACYDSTRGDSGLRSVFAPPDSQKNVSVFIQPFQPFADSVHFTAFLQDQYNDGYFAVHATDSVGQTTYANIDIPGFTLRAAKAVMPDTIQRIVSDAPVGKYYCQSVSLTNYGKFSQTLTKSSFKTSGTPFSVSSNFPITIAPGNTADIDICFLTNIQGLFLDTLEIANNCAERTVAIFNYNAQRDTLPPEVTRIEDSCGVTVTFDAFETSPIDLGIANVEIIDSATKNCALTVERLNNNRQAHIIVKVANIYEDAFYLLRISDSAGNSRMYSDTIPGLTIAVESRSDSTILGVIRFDSTELRHIICDTVFIINYGKYPLKFQQLSPVINTIFSSPQTQFPISLAPGERHLLALCYSPSQVKDISDNDTLRIGLRCLSRDILLQGNALPIMRSGSSQCDVPIVLRSTSVPTSFYLDDIFPNPLQKNNEMTIKFGLSESDNISISAFNSQGIQQIVIVDGYVERGEYNASFVTKNLHAGLYCIVFRTRDFIVTKKFIVF